MTQEEMIAEAVKQPDKTENVKSYANTTTKEQRKNEISKRTMLLKAQCSQDTYVITGRRISDDIKSKLNNIGKITCMAYNEKSQVWNITLSNSESVKLLENKKVQLLNKNFGYLRAKVQEHFLITVMCDATVLNDEICEEFSKFGKVNNIITEPVPWDDSIMGNKRKVFIDLDNNIKVKDLPLTLLIGEHRYPIYYRGKVFPCKDCLVRHYSTEECTLPNVDEFAPNSNISFEKQPQVEEKKLEPSKVAVEQKKDVNELPTSGEKSKSSVQTNVPKGEPFTIKEPRKRQCESPCEEELGIGEFENISKTQSDEHRKWSTVQRKKLQPKQTEPKKKKTTQSEMIKIAKPDLSNYVNFTVTTNVPAVKTE